jgi:hypothetical protein
MLAALFTLTVASASMALAQGSGGGGGGGGMGGMRMAPPDHWITADSLAKAVGGDAAVAKKAAPHLAEVDKVMKTAADERAKAFANGRPDQATMQAFRGKAEEWQKSVDEHLKAIRDALDAKQQAAFDALQKPQMMRRGGGGMGGGMGGGRPPQ